METFIDESVNVMQSIAMIMNEREVFVVFINSYYSYVETIKNEG